MQSVGTSNSKAKCPGSVCLGVPAKLEGSLLDAELDPALLSGDGQHPVSCGSLDTLPLSRF
jgi:hypothetical protein